MIRNLFIIVALFTIPTCAHSEEAENELGFCHDYSRQILSSDRGWLSAERGDVIDIFRRTSDRWVKQLEVANQGDVFFGPDETFLVQIDHTSYNLYAPTPGHENAWTSTLVDLSDTLSRFGDTIYLGRPYYSGRPFHSSLRHGGIYIDGQTSFRSFGVSGHNGINIYSIDYDFTVQKRLATPDDVTTFDVVRDEHGYPAGVISATTGDDYYEWHSPEGDRTLTDIKILTQPTVFGPIIKWNGGECLTYLQTHIYNSRGFHCYDLNKQKSETISEDKDSIIWSVRITVTEGEPQFQYFNLREGIVLFGDRIASNRVYLDFHNLPYESAKPVSLIDNVAFCRNKKLYFPDAQRFERVYNSEVYYFDGLVQTDNLLQKKRHLIYLDGGPWRAVWERPEPIVSSLNASGESVSVIAYPQTLGRPVSIFSKEEPTIEDVLDEIHRVALYLKAELDPEVELILVGHSYGALLATMLQVRYPSVFPGAIAVNGPGSKCRWIRNSPRSPAHETKALGPLFGFTASSRCENKYVEHLFLTPEEMQRLNALVISFEGDNLISPSLSEYEDNGVELGPNVSAFYLEGGAHTIRRSDAFRVLPAVKDYLDDLLIINQ